MKPPVRLGIVLLVLGALIFTYQGVLRVTHRQTAPSPAPEAAVEKADPFPVSQAIGTLATAGGIFLVVLGSRRS